MSGVTFIVGAPRSGTSAITRVFEACGAELGDIYHTHAEHRGAKEWVKRMLRTRRYDPLGQHPIPKRPVPVKGQEIERLVSLLSDVDVVKDVKFVWFWPQLIEAMDAKFVVVERDPVQVGKSCARAPFMKAHGSDVSAWAAYAAAYQMACADLCRKHPDRVSRVSLSEAFDGDTSRLSRAVEASGLKWRPRLALKSIDAKKWSGG